MESTTNLEQRDAGPSTAPPPSADKASWSKKKSSMRRALRKAVANVAKDQASPTKGTKGVLATGTVARQESSYRVGCAKKLGGSPPEVENAERKERPFRKRGESAAFKAPKRRTETPVRLFGPRAFRCSWRTRARLEGRRWSTSAPRK